MRVIFLDRDGVINEYPGDTKFVTTWKEFKFIPGSLKALKKLKEAGFDIIVVSNQSGISKGAYSREALNDITKRMMKEVEKKHAKISSVFYCTHKTEDECGHRKPDNSQIDLILRKYKSKKINLDPIYFIGDSIRDIQTGKKSGLKTILVLSGKEKLSNKDNWEEKPDYIARNLNEAVDLVLKNLRQVD